MYKSNVPEELFLRRDYHLITGGNVTLIVYHPTKFSEGSDFECEYEIRGLRSLVQRTAGGIDGLQCVLLALEMAAACKEPNFRI